MPSTHQWTPGGQFNFTTGQYDTGTQLVERPFYAAQTQQMNTALGGGVGSREYSLMQRAEMDKVKGQYSDLRRGLERDIYRRGIGRSGFAGEMMSRLGAQQGGAIGDVKAGVTERLADYQAQQREIGLQLKAQREQKKNNRKKTGIGAGLGVAGLVLAPFTGGASLGLTAAGGGMMLS